MNKQKLELTWIGKDKRPRLEPRILLEDKGLSYQAPSITTNSESDDGCAFNDNLLIHGDNLLALKALEQQYAGKVKCIFIDPPYNTGSAFTHYDDGLEHSMWLSMMRDRLELLRMLMSEDGSIWITIDDNEAHYLKVICDDIFGRKNYVSSICWQKKYAVKSDSEFFSSSHDNLLVYAKNISKFKLNRFARTAEQDSRYKNQDNDPRGPWTSGPLQRNEARDYAIYPIVSPMTGKSHMPPSGTSWRYNHEKLLELIADNRIWFGESGNNVPRLKRFLSEVADSVPATTWWDYSNFGHNDEARREQKALNLDSNDLFSTPKPEKLISKIIELSSNLGDLVLDSFGGSGTTGAVAHKMGRRWIMVELGEHCHTHIVPRLKKVIDGEDQGGISKAVNWQGGGGFRYLRLAPSLLKKDDWGNWVINKEYNAEMLAEAVCKHMGFTYAPSQTQFWNHGYSTETDHIYVTTGSLAYDQLKRISEEVGNERTLLICCKAFMMDGADFPNLTLKKIPKVILNKCEWDHDDYSFTLNVLPEEQDEEWADDDSEE
ncbi:MULTISPECIES: site-specific DNA-methyltransferase [Aeromonas]|uniref:site-specific DNA-methyltransferase n=1 Tax=Aeromonas TaxID=642 RepID=UPI001C233905|nr:MULTISPECIES: site-specific DNA-methyltransferase [Aeromonas]MCJ8233542.1 site-specific DNA-methyltransferase [Aeromonas veronii]QWZ86052.1 site-specific DNA-methyltransferase [Aeromonas sp. FDAARGOS 1404]UUT58522.1 site-specific DNA-methyltransferase [Aeromonas hydrophila]BED99882.1 site-specific DNA-methyltransferase [Aeromonas dhakensis]